MIKSIHSSTPVSVVFTNKTERNVDLFWIDFNGRCVRYQNGLKHAQYYKVSTYETHPWIAKDSKTGSPLLIQNHFTYYPEVNEDVATQQIPIGLPVYSLVDRCLDVLRSHGVNHTADGLEIPATLKKELKKAQVPHYRDYNGRR